MQPDYHERVQELIVAGQSRAVLAATAAGESASCEKCGDNVLFKAKEKLGRVICNVYVEGIWTASPTYHPQCYVEENAPHGPVLEGNVHGMKRSAVERIINEINSAPTA